MSLTLAFASRWARVGLADASLKELAFLAVFSWGAIASLRFFRFSKIGALITSALTLLLVIHLFLDWRRAGIFINSEGSFLACHIAGALAGEIFAVIACFLSIVYLGQRRFLKEKRFAHLIRKLPALDFLEDVWIALLSTGFLFLSVALVSGVIFLFYTETDHFRDHITKLIWALVVWIWYLSALFARLVRDLPTKTLAKQSVLGFCLLLGAYFGFIF